MTTVAILGAGDIAASAARALAARDCVQRILMVDAAASVAAGKALDIQQAGAIEAFHTTLAATDDMSRITGCAVCIVADRSGAAAGEWTGEDALATLGRISPFLAGAPMVFAGTEQAPLIAAAARELGIRRERLIGSAPEALVSAAVSMVAMEARCSPREVGLTVLGVPPAGVVIPWGEASIGGCALSRLLDPVQLTRIEARVASLWPPGPYALGAAAARVAEAIVTGARASYSVLTAIDGEFGVRHSVGILPAMLSRAGIVHARVPALDTRDRVRVETALSR